MLVRNVWVALIGASGLLLAACASGAGGTWTAEALGVALADPSRPQADRDRDADRKPAQLMTFFGVERGMTVADLLAGPGYMTEVLSVAVGATGKVYAQNSAPVPAMDERLANNRLSNVVKIEGDMTTVPAGTVDIAITVMNLHDIYNGVGPEPTQVALRSIYGLLRPGGLLGVVDHVGVNGADNAKLHRMTRQQAVDTVTAAGFVLEAESDVLAHGSDDHTLLVTDPAIRGTTDQFTLKFRKPR